MTNFHIQTTALWHPYRMVVLYVISTNELSYSLRIHLVSSLKGKRKLSLQSYWRSYILYMLAHLVEKMWRHTFFVRNLRKLISSVTYITRNQRILLKYEAFLLTQQCIFANKTQLHIMSRERPSISVKNLREVKRMWICRQVLKVTVVICYN